MTLREQVLTTRAVTRWTVISTRDRNGTDRHPRYRNSSRGRNIRLTCHGCPHALVVIGFTILSSSYSGEKHKLMWYSGSSPVPMITA